MHPGHSILSRQPASEAAEAAAAAVASAVLSVWPVARSVAQFDAGWPDE